MLDRAEVHGHALADLLGSWCRLLAHVLLPYLAHTIALMALYWTLHLKSKLQSSTSYHILTRMPKLIMYFDELTSHSLFALSRDLLCGWSLFQTGNSFHSWSFSQRHTPSSLGHHFHPEVSFQVTVFLEYRRYDMQIIVQFQHILYILHHNWNSLAIIWRPKWSQTLYMIYLIDLMV